MLSVWLLAGAASVWKVLFFLLVVLLRTAGETGLLGRVGGRLKTKGAARVRSLRVLRLDAVSIGFWHPRSVHNRWPRGARINALSACFVGKSRLHKPILPPHAGPFVRRGAALVADHSRLQRAATARSAPREDDRAGRHPSPRVSSRGRLLEGTRV